MVQLVRKAGEGGTEMEILRRFSRPDVANHPDNHVLPLLDELVCLDMAFAIVPLLEDSLLDPWFFNLGEALDAVAQTFKVRGTTLAVRASANARIVAGSCIHAFALRRSSRYRLPGYSDELWWAAGKMGVRSSFERAGPL